MSAPDFPDHDGENPSRRDIRRPARGLRTEGELQGAIVGRRAASNALLVLTRNLPLSHAVAQAAAAKGFGIAIYLAADELASIPFWSFDAVVIDAALWAELATLDGTRAAQHLGTTPVVLIDQMDRMEHASTRFPVRVVDRLTGATSGPSIIESVLTITQREELERQRLLTDIARISSETPRSNP